MAETKEVIIPVKTVGVEEADKQIKNLTKTQEAQTDATEEGTKATEEQGETLVDVAKDVKIFGISINSISAGLKATVKVLKTSVTGLKAFRFALIATGVGVIVIALGSLVLLLTKTQGGMDLVTKVTNALGVAFDILIDRAITFGRGIVKLFTGDFKGAIEDFSSSVSGITEEFKEEIKASNDLSDAFAALEKRQIAFISINKQLRAEAKEQNKLAEDTNRLFTERAEAAQNVVDIEQERTRQAIALAEEELRILEERNSFATETNETLREEAELRARVFEIREESDERITTAQNRLNILVTQANKATQDQIKLANELIKVQNQGLDLQIAKQGIVIKGKEDDVDATDNQIQSEKDLGNTIGGIGVALGQFGKAGAIASALGQLGVAIARVFGQTGVFGFAAIGPVIGAITAAITSIKSATIPTAPTFAHGGYIGGNLHSQGGTMINAERGEYMISRRAMQNKGIADIAQALNSYGQSKGFKFQEGGFIGARGQISFAEMDNLLSRIDRSVLVTEDLNIVQNRVRVTEERATL
jgi:hypothetical protein